VDCPLDCEYLREARRRARPPALAEEDIPHADIEITEEFLESNSNLLIHCAIELLEAARRVPGANDRDAREALDSMIQTHRTLESGLIYTTRPDNPLAAAIQKSVQDSIEKLRQELTKQTGTNPVRDKDVLGILIFLARVGVANDNGRRRGRAFLSFLEHHFHKGTPGTASSLITP